MTFSRKQLKEQAKEALARNYWRIVLVSFLAMLFCDGLFGAGHGARNNSAHVSSRADIEVEQADSSAAHLAPAKDRDYAVKTSQMVGLTIFS